MCLTDQQIEKMVAKTNSELAKINVGITMEEVGSAVHVGKKELAYVSLNNKEDEFAGFAQKQFCRQPPIKLRGIPVKVDLNGNCGSRTYDPFDDTDEACETQGTRHPAIHCCTC